MAEFKQGVSLTMKRFPVEAAIAFLGCVWTHAAMPSPFASPEAFAQSLKSKVSQSAKGDLNGDGLDDWVGAVAPMSGKESDMHRIVVLLQKKHGRYEPAGGSERFLWSQSGSDFNELDIDIKKGSFYVRFNFSSRFCAENERSQFRLEGNRWHMIGVTYRASDLSDPDVVRWYARDANLVTGDEILTLQGKVKERKKFSTLDLDLQKFPYDYRKVYRTTAMTVCH